MSRMGGIGASVLRGFGGGVGVQTPERKECHGWWLDICQSRLQHSLVGFHKIADSQYFWTSYPPLLFVVLFCLSASCGGGGASGLLLSAHFLTIQQTFYSKARLCTAPPLGTNSSLNPDTALSLNLVLGKDLVDVKSFPNWRDEQNHPRTGGLWQSPSISPSAVARAQCSNYTQVNLPNPITLTFEWRISNARY